MAIGEAPTDGLDVVPEAVLVLDGEERVVAANDRAVTVFVLDDAALGRPAAEVLGVRDDAGNPCGSLLPAEARGTGRVVARLAETVVQAHVQGRRRPQAMSGRRLDDGWVLTFRGAARREAVDVARADVVATVSHEIRSPLTSVKGFTKTLLRRWDRFSDEQKRHMLETIDADADRVTRLLTELLDVSRIDAGRVQLHRRMVELGPLVERVAEGALARHEGREVHVDVADGLAAYLDPDKVTQVLTNLVENALRYADSSPVWITGERVDDEAVVAVRDEGPGVPVDQQVKIFDKFGRGKESRRAGTGLGLFISRGLVRAHGGDVTLTSVEGRGATFTMTLPAELPPALRTS